MPVHNDGREVAPGNEDLSAVDSHELDSNSSDDLSANSETYDFLMVYMPQIRPKVVEPDEAAEESKRAGSPKKSLKS